MPLPPIPEIASRQLASMTPKELRLAQEELWAWIESAESLPQDTAPDEDTIEKARQTLNEIIAERRSLHGDEPAPRGG